MFGSVVLTTLLATLASKSDAFTFPSQPLSRGTSMAFMDKRMQPTVSYTSTSSSTLYASESEDDAEVNNIEEESSKAVEEEDEVKQPSAAEAWQKQQNQEDESESESENNSSPKRKYVVVGGGWGGWGAAQALCENKSIDCEVTLLDALPDPTGAMPYLSANGKPVEAGTRGFWKDYPNINYLCEQLGINEDDVFTPFTNSSFYSPDGLEATAPVFSESNPFEKLPFDIPLPFGISKDDPFPQLPSPLGQVLATFPLFERLPLSDRASMVGLLLATIDCLGAEDEATKESYDRMTAHDLFIRFGLSKRLVDDFIRPTLLVGLFKPPEELSALVVMELLYYYALAHQDSFDVRWIKNGTVADSLILPLANMLQEDHGLNVMGGCRVGEISLEEDADGNVSNARTVTYIQNGEEYQINDVDGVVLALGCKGMESVVRASPDLARLPTFSKAASLRGIDVISTRIWFDEVVETRTPANVFARFEELRGSGGTFFMLDQLQGNTEELWGGEEPQGSVVACDFYNAGGVMSMSDEDVIKTLTEDLLPSAVPKFKDAKVVDSWVGKYAGTVSWFSPGSYTSRPPLEGAGNDVLPNVKIAGDWVKMGDREHGAKGLCQERAYVSGMEAANSLLKTTGDVTDVKEVLQVREDEEQFKLGVSVNNQVMKVLPRFWVR